MIELHQRYGEFSDENIVKEFNNKTLTAVYTNRDFLRSFVIFGTNDTTNCGIFLSDNGDSKGFSVFVSC